MKKQLLLLYVTIGIGTTYAQSFQITKHGTTTPVTALTENMTQNDLYETKFDIKNISSSTKSYKIKKNIISVPTGCAEPQSLSFCDKNNCYPDFLSVSSSIPIAPGEVHDPNPGTYGISAHLPAVTAAELM